MSHLQMKLDSLFKRVGVAHLIPNGFDGDLHKFVCQLLNVNKVRNVLFQYLNEISASLNCIVTTSDKQQIYNTILDYEKSLA